MSKQGNLGWTLWQHISTEWGEKLHSILPHVIQTTAKPLFAAQFLDKTETPYYFLQEKAFLLKNTPYYTSTINHPINVIILIKLFYSLSDTLTQKWWVTTLCKCVGWLSVHRHKEGCSCAQHTVKDGLFSLSMTESVSVSVCVCGTDSRHSHVAAIYDDVSELLTSWLIWQLQSVRSSQWLMETSQTSHRGKWGVVCRSPCSDSMKPHVANGLIRRGWRPGDGLSWLKTKMKTMMYKILERQGDDLHQWPQPTHGHSSTRLVCGKARWHGKNLLTLHFKPSAIIKYTKLYKQNAWSNNIYKLCKSSRSY